MIALVDCNNFYVSCERSFAPRLEGLPVGVLSNNDGCIIARSQEIKTLGVEMGTPVHQLSPELRRQCVLLSSNYALYGSMSARITAVLGQYTPDLEVYSIDESFLSFDGFPGGDALEDCCQALRQQVRRETGIPVSIGLSSSKTLAKIANHLAKRQAVHEGVATLEPDSPVTRQVLEQLPVTEVWGVAGRTAARLQSLGITTAWQLRETDPKRIRSHFSVVMERIVLELRGIDCITLDDLEQPKKQIMTSRSFGRLTNDLLDLREAVRTHASRGSEKLRAQASLAQSVMVFVRTPPHRQDLHQYSKSVLVGLPHPTADSCLIVWAALHGLEALYRRGYQFQKCGVMLTDLCSRAHEQLDLMADQQSDDKRQRRERLMATLDRLNTRHGRGTVSLGLNRKENAWRLRCANRSPRYTTCWDELPNIKC